MTEWLTWLCAPQDAPLLLVSGLVLALWALGWSREPSIPGEKSV